MLIRETMSVDIGNDGGKTILQNIKIQTTGRRGELTLRDKYLLDTDITNNDIGITDRITDCMSCPSSV